jgi:hypothetical protein
VVEEALAPALQSDGIIDARAVGVAEMDVI